MLMRWAYSPVILLYIRLAITAPIDYFPINSQLPPVARISEAFSFIFSPVTFSSPYAISYSLVDAPGWLSLDSNNRRLYGTPTDQDVAPGVVVGIPISITAEDKDGYITVNSTLAVSRNPPPEVKIPLSDQLSRFGAYSPPSSIILDSSTDFSFSFDANTFDEARLNYYAVSANNAPLPSWINFEADGISFSGRTPSFESLLQPQSFDIQLVASEVIGFSSISVPFSIVVGNHELTADPALVVLNATPGTFFQYEGLANILELDDSPLDQSYITAVTTNELPDWLQFNTESWEFSGTPGSTANTTNFTVAITDVYSDNLNVTMVIKIGTDIFISDIPALDVSTGETISFDMKPYLRGSLDVEIEIENQSQVPWLRIDPSELELLGTVPLSTSPFEVDVSFKAHVRGTQETALRTLTIYVAVAKAVPSSADSTATFSTAAASTSMNSSPPSGGSSFSNSSTKTILISVLIPLILLCVVVVIFLGIRCLQKRRRQRQTDERIPEVSAPIPGSFVKHDASSFEEGPHDTFDAVSAITGTRTNSGSFTVDPLSKVQDSSSTASLRNNNAPDAMTFYSFDFRKPPNSSAGREPREPWLVGQKLPRQIPTTPISSRYSPSTRTSPGTEKGEAISLSSTSSTDDHHIHGATAALVISPGRPKPLRRSFTSPVPGLSVSVVDGLSCAQATPEFSYVTGGMALNREATNTMRLPAYMRDSISRGVPGFGIQRLKASTSHVTGTSVPNAWKRASSARMLDEQKHKSSLSLSTVQTTRTSILTSGTAEDSAASRRSSRPTNANISSHSEEVRQISRRVDDSSALFGGGSIMKSPKHFGLPVNPSAISPIEPLFKSTPLGSYSTTGYSDADSLWERTTRNSPGFTHRDIIQSGRSPTKSPMAARRSPSSAFMLFPGKETERRLHWREEVSHDLMSPDLWPRPQTNGSSIRSTSSRAATRFPVSVPSAAPVIPGKNHRRSRPPSKRQSGEVKDSPDRDVRVPPLAISGNLREKAFHNE